VKLADQPPRVQDALKELALRLGARFDDALVLLRLFGSRARGQANAGSDVDVAVVLEHAGWRERCAVIDVAADVGLEYDLDVSPTVLDRSTYERWRDQERPLVLDIEREGIPL
jgi:predicted nucleotidyltransferase